MMRQGLTVQEGGGEKELTSTGWTGETGELTGRGGGG